MGKLKTVPAPRKLPVILSREEVARLLEAAHSLKYKAAFSAAYGAGLRMSEVTSLKISDIDGERKTQHVEQGRKDRYAMLSPALLNILQRWWLVVPRTEPGQPDQQPSAVSCHYCRRRRCRDR